MALDNKVLIDEEVLTTLSNKAFGDGATHTIEDIISNLGPNVTDYFTNTEKYGYIVGNGTSSSAIAALSLPEGIDFNDIVFAVGIGGVNNSSISSRSAYNMSYIYCPALYNHVVGTNTTTGEPNERDCFGFAMGLYSTTYEHDAWTPLATGSTYGTVYRPTLFKATDATDGKHRIGLGYYQGGTLSSSNGYLICKYGSIVVIYRKK